MVRDNDTNEPLAPEALLDQLKVVSRHGATGADQEEVAAALAVLSEVLAEEAAEIHDAESGVDGWASRGHAMRTPVIPGPGQWSRNVDGSY